MVAVRLTCNGCGADLDISEDIDRFACSYCGTQHLVERKGGIVTLKSLLDKVGKVHLETTKAAAELAIVRLEKEIAKLNEEKTTVLQATQEMSPAAKNFITGVVIVVGVGFLALWAYAGMCAVIVAFFLLSLVAAPLGNLFGGLAFVVDLIGGKALREKWEKERRDNISRIDTEIDIRRQELERNRRIVSG